MQYLALSCRLTLPLLVIHLYKEVQRLGLLGFIEETSRVHFPFDGGVPVILHSIVGSAEEAEGNKPSAAIAQVAAPTHSPAPSQEPNMQISMGHPAGKAAASKAVLPPRQQLGNLCPAIPQDLVGLKYDAILLLCPRGLLHFRVQVVMPALPALLP